MFREIKPSDMDALLATHIDVRGYVGKPGKPLKTGTKSKKSRRRKTPEELAISHSQAGISRNRTKEEGTAKLERILKENHNTETNLVKYLVDRLDIGLSFEDFQDRCYVRHIENIDNKDNCKLQIVPKDETRKYEFIVKWCNTSNFELKQITPEHFAEQMKFSGDKKATINLIKNSLKQNSTEEIEQIVGVITKEDIKEFFRMNDGKAQFIVFPYRVRNGIPRLWIADIDECFKGDGKVDDSIRFSNKMKKGKVISVLYDLRKLTEHPFCECLSD